MAKPIMASTVRSDLLEDIKYQIAHDVLSPQALQSIEGYVESALDIENTIASKLSELPPEEFEDILRSAFKEDEWILIFVGALLGGAISVLQMLIMGMF